MSICSHEWTLRAQKHALRVSLITDPFLKRRSVGAVHPVHDFLFTYYPFSPLKLKQWVPSFEERLIVTPEILKEFPWINDYWFQIEGNELSLRKERFHEGVRGLLSFVKELCENILNKPPRLGCFGLHEWAMVYKIPSDSLRHKSHPLRMSHEDLADFVESQAVCCSHYDAYRFFTPEAKPLNQFNPLLETRLQMEQSGCIHANMDLYKWATKLWPWVGSDFIGETFFFALDCRNLDMRASPYDLQSAGFTPIRIETEEGRREYQKEQLALAERSIPLRKELLRLSSSLLQH